MVRPALLACLVPALLAVPTDAVARDPASRLQQMYAKALQRRGYASEIDDDGDVRFERHGYTYFLKVSPEDPGYFQLTLPNIWPIDSTLERARVLQAVNAADATIKVAKAFVHRDDVWVSVELFVSHPRHFQPLLDRSLSAVDDAVFHFAEHMKLESI